MILTQASWLKKIYCPLIDNKARTSKHVNFANCCFASLLTPLTAIIQTAHMYRGIVVPVVLI